MDDYDANVTLSHDRWVVHLSEHLDGTLESGAASELEAHLDRCPECARLAEELHEVRDLARASRPISPPRDLWPDIRARLNEAEVVPFPGAEDGESRVSRAPRTIRFTVPQLAAAAVALMLGTGVAGWVLGGGGAAPVEVAGAPVDTPADVRPAALGAADDPDSELGDDLRRLEVLLRQGSERLSPEVRRLVESNLAVIERAIYESRAALEVDPGNGYLERHLNGVLERKRDYLRQAADLVSEADD